MDPTIEESLARIAAAFERIALAANEMLALSELEMREEGYVRDSLGQWTKG
jgi:hypothetical protein